jgi:hypothetical protein
MHSCLGVGWEWAFVFYSLLVFVWTYYWGKLGVGIIPSEVARCSKEEAAYLEGKRADAQQGQQDGPPPFDLTIWWAMVKQPVVWGMTLYTVISGIGKPVFLTYVPQYLVTQLNFDIKSAGFLASLPFLSNAAAHLVAGTLGDKLHRDGMSNVTIRRMFTMGPQVIYMVVAVLLANGVGPYLAILLLILAQFGEGFTGSGIWTKSLDISKRYSTIAHGFLNGMGNITYYALSGSMIGTFLHSGGYGTSAQGRCSLSAPPPLDNEWSAKINGTVGPIGECSNEDGQTGCISKLCTDAIDSCMKDSAILILEKNMEAKLDHTDADLCRETWNTLFMLSGCICMVSGICFWVTSGAEEIDSIIDPIAVAVAQKRGWDWGRSLGHEPAPSNGHSVPSHSEPEQASVAQPAGPVAL